MPYDIEVIDQTIILTLHNSPKIDIALRAASVALLDVLDQQQLPVFLIVDIKQLPHIACDEIVDRSPPREVQIMFSHPRIREVIITAPEAVYGRHARDSMYKPYSSKPILLTRSGHLARGYVADSLRRAD